VFDHPRRELILTQCRDHIVGELRPGSDLVDEPVDLRAKVGTLLVRLPLTPTSLVQLTPPVNEFKHPGEALMGQSIVHGDDRTEQMRQAPGLLPRPCRRPAGPHYQPKHADPAQWRVLDRHADVPTASR
jgi:hypothetical protein